MPDARGWPDPERPGFPMDQSLDGPHLLISPHGRRTWAWWSYPGRVWQLPSQPNAVGDPRGSLDPRMAAKEWIYLGPATAPDRKSVP